MSKLVERFLYKFIKTYGEIIINTKKYIEERNKLNKFYKKYRDKYKSCLHKKYIIYGHKYDRQKFKNPNTYKSVLPTIDLVFNNTSMFVLNSWNKFLAIQCGDYTKCPRDIGIAHYFPIKKFSYDNLRNIYFIINKHIGDKNE